MKHVLLIFHHYRSPKDPGGLRSWHIGSHLARKGFRVTAVVPGVDTLSGKKHPELKMKLWCREIADKVEIIRVNSTKNDRKSKLRRALYYLSSSLLQFIASLFVKKVDIVVSTSIPLSSLFIAFVQAKIRRIPFVIDVRDLSIDTAIELGYFSNNIFFKSVLKSEAWLFKHSDYLISVSDGMGNFLKKKGVSPNKIEVIPIGYDGKDVYKHYVNWNRDVKSEIGLRGKFIVLYAGTMGHVIDIPTIINCAQKTAYVKDIVYLFVGQGQRLEEYRKIAINNNLNCIFLGPRKKSDISLFCSQADVCVYPLKGGPIVASLLGNKIFDYLGNGTITVYSGPEGDVKRLIDRSKGGICVPAGDSESLAQAIIYLYNNPDQKKLLGTQAKRYIENKYTVKKMMAKFELSISMLLK